MKKRKENKIKKIWLINENIATFIPLSDPHELPVALLFLVHNLRGIPQENFFPKFSIYVGYKFNTVW